jgi:hypothetical protein
MMHRLTPQTQPNMHGGRVPRPAMGYASGSKSNHLSKVSAFQANHCVDRPFIRAFGMVAWSEPLSVMPRIRFHVFSLETFSLIS